MWTPRRCRRAGCSGHGGRGGGRGTRDPAARSSATLGTTHAARRAAPTPTWCLLYRRLVSHDDVGCTTRTPRGCCHASHCLSHCAQRVVGVRYTDYGTHPDARETSEALRVHSRCRRSKTPGSAREQLWLRHAVSSLIVYAVTVTTLVGNESRQSTTSLWPEAHTPPDTEAH